jgi:cyclopropane fatty-acyl-phospholipid synthase-like methyltransferase
MVDEGHLGGFIIESDPATFTPTLWKHICEKYKIKSVLDLGCGMGYAISEFAKYCDDVVGLEGSDYVKKHSQFSEFMIQIDFTKEKYSSDKKYDLLWSCEFVEHVDETFIENYENCFKNSKYCAITYADVNQDGHNHVNCKPKEYWIDKICSWGFEYLENDFNELKEISYEDALKYNNTYKDNHFYNRGLFFKNINNYFIDL